MVVGWVIADWPEQPSSPLPPMTARSQDITNNHRIRDREHVDVSEIPST
jgi:hypothetical protein